MTLMLFGALALIVAGAAARWLQGIARARAAMLDHPGDRSLHMTPTPRVGGVAIAAGFLPAAACVFLAGDIAVRLLLTGWLLVFAVSLVDDLRSLPFWARLPVHVAAALCVVLAPGYPADPLSVGVGIFWIVWGTNLFNFMDGMDGLAGSMSVIGGGALAAALAVTGAGELALPVAAAASASAGFLVFNRPPARIFMGDAGSASLGFLFAAASIAASGRGELPAWLPVFVFLPFIADATLTLLRRAIQRKPVWRAHREHLYQALVLSGWPVPRVLLAGVVVMLGCAGGGLVMFVLDGPGWPVLLATGALTVAGYYGMMSRLR